MEENRKLTQLEWLYDFEALAFWWAWTDLMDNRWGESSYSVPILLINST